MRNSYLDNTAWVAVILMIALAASVIFFISLVLPDGSIYRVVLVDGRVLTAKYLNTQTNYLCFEPESGGKTCYPFDKIERWFK